MCENFKFVCLSWLLFVEYFNVTSFIEKKLLKCGEIDLNKLICIILLFMINKYTLMHITKGRN